MLFLLSVLHFSAFYYIQIADWILLLIALNTKILCQIKSELKCKELNEKANLSFCNISVCT